MRRVAKILTLVLCFVLIYASINTVLAIKADDGVSQLKHFYALPKDTVDVLFVGSSHIGLNLDPRLMMEEYGIASYALWSSMQTPWNSYYYIKEALKSQKPKVVVTELFICGSDSEYIDTAAALKGIQPMHPSLDKLRLALESFPTWHQAAEAFWGMPTYHSRYSELTEEDYADFSPQDTSIQQAKYNLIDNTPVEMLDYKNIFEVQPLAKKQEKYLRKIIALCKSKKIPLVLLISPYAASMDEATRFNRIEEIASEENVPLLNYLKRYESIGFDPQNDFFDAFGHMNVNGTPKFTRSLADYLSETFTLPDRREDPAHIWYEASVIQTESKEPVYQLKETFTGDGYGRYLDTGVKLLEDENASWTLFARLDTRTFGDDAVYFSCFNEVSEVGYFGLLLKKDQEGTLNLKVGNNENRSIAYSDDQLDLAIVKDGIDYTVYVNCLPVINEAFPCKPYSGTLLIGCQEQSPGGEKFRFSRTHIMDLELYDEAMNARSVEGWVPESLPETPPPIGIDSELAEVVYTMPEQFVGGEGYVQDDYIDTGVRLVDSSATRFTLLTSVTPRATMADNVYFSCFAEEPENWRGVMVRQTDDQTLQILVGNNYGIDVPIEIGKMMRLAIVKDGSLYTIYANGVKVMDNHDIPASAYAGTLIVGAQVTAEGEIFRTSMTNVNSLSVVSGVMDEQSILNWPYEEAPMPEKMIPSSVAYSLEDPFAGDGESFYVDTGKMLFDVPSKDWTLHAVVHTRQGVNAGVFFSCFNEGSGGYRGLMLRQDTPDDITLFVGQLETHTIELTLDNRQMNLVLVKEGNVYTLYVNGSRTAQMESASARYLGTLLIGCQASAEGEPFRFSKAMVDVLELWDGAMNDADALALSAQKEQKGRFN